MLSFVFTKIEKEPDQISEATGTSVGFPIPQRASIPSLSGGGFGEKKFNQTPSKISTSRSDLVLINSNPLVQIIASDQQEYYENYYTTGDADHGITNIHTYKIVTYKDVYPDIDIVLKVKEQGLEYSFIVHPGGDVNDIELSWDGMQNRQFIKDGSVKYANLLGSIKESAPRSFVEGKKIKSSFRKTGADYGFKVAKYDKKKDLVIDPDLIWATYYGGKSGDIALNICTDASNNIYVTGETYSTTGIATSGSYKTNYSGGGGNSNTFIAKFNNSGSRIWATYYGGSGNDRGVALSVDVSGNIYLAGYTASSGGIATSGAYQSTFGGGSWDAFLVKFSSTGSLSWGTYLGGNKDDFGYGITTNGGYVYITGETQSTSNIATFGAFQSSFGVSSDDAFLAKFSSTGSIVWSTYFGQNSSGDGVTFDGSANIFISGITANNGMATSGAYQTSIAGNGDAFLAKFNSSGNRIWATYFGGNSREEAYRVKTDIAGDIFITGSTQSSSGIATSGAYQTSYSGGNNDVFLAKFSGTGSLSWATYYGGSGDDEAYGLDVDAFGNIFISGLTNSNYGIATSGAYQTSYGGGNLDGFIAKFSNNGSLSSATYFGGSNNDDADCVSVDTSGIVYIAGSTNSTSGIASLGAYQTKLAGINDVYIAKFFFDPYQTDAGILSILNPDTAFCTGSDSIKVMLKNFGNNELDAVKINWSVNNKLQTPYTWSGKLNSDTISIVSIGSYSFQAGTYIIKAWTSNANGVTDSLPGNDSATSIITSKAYPLAIVGKTATICAGTIDSLGSIPTSGNSYNWTSSPSGFISTMSNPVVNPIVTTTFFLTETVNSGGCSKLDSVVISVNASPQAIKDSMKTVCAGQNVKIGINSINGHTYSWQSVPSGFTSAISNPIVTPIITTTYILTESLSVTGCSTQDSTIITTKISPSPAISGANSICAGSSGSYFTKGNSGDTYIWTSVNGSITSNPKARTVNISWPNPGSGMLKVVESNPNGCIDSAKLNVTINSLPTGLAGTPQSICSGESVFIGSSSISGYNYTWVSYPIGFSSTISNPNVSPSNNTIYILTETVGATGCSKTDSVDINVNPKPNAAFSFTNVCPGDSSPFTDKSKSASSYSWAFGDSKTSTLTNPKHLYLNNGSYNVVLKVANSYGCYDSLSQKLTISPCVWPGDANNDKTVDMKDFLAVGIAYGTKGYPRPSPSASWTGQVSPDWSSAFASGVNYKHADCNGDSIINYYDTLAISTNYGKSHLKSSPLDQGSPTDPPFSINYSRDTFYAGDTLEAQVLLGSNSNSIKNLYGLKFSINANPLLLDVENAILKLNSSFLGSPQTEMMGMKIYNLGNSEMDLGLTRITQTNTSGFGNVATISIPIKSKLPAEYNRATLTVSDNLQISFKGQKVPLYFTSDTVLIKQDRTGIQSIANNGISNLNIYPNPFLSTTTIQYSLFKPSKVKISLFDITGKEIGNIVDENEITGKYQFDISTDRFHLHTGVYLLKFIVNGQYESRDIVNF